MATRKRKEDRVKKRKERQEASRGVFFLFFICFVHPCLVLNTIYEECNLDLLFHQWKYLWFWRVLVLCPLKHGIFDRLFLHAEDIDVLMPMY